MCRATEVLASAALLEEASAALASASQPNPASRSRVLAALARVIRHGTALEGLDPRAATAAREAVAQARACGDPGALGPALLAQHDVLWTPGLAQVRLPVLVELADAAERAGDRDLAAEAVSLRAAALIEAGDPAGLGELARYTRLADGLGHARGRWAALSWRATLAQVAGRIDEAVGFADQALELGLAIGLPDAMGCYGTLRGSLAAIGGPVMPFNQLMPAADPMRPIYPLLTAWMLVLAGDTATAVEMLEGFSVQVVPTKYDLEMVAVTATVFAEIGSDQQREWAYRTFAHTPARTPSSEDAPHITAQSITTWACWPPPSAASTRRSRISPTRCRAREARRLSVGPAERNQAR